MILIIEIIAWVILLIFALRGARWAYAIFLVLAFVWIPARTGFHLHRPPCQMFTSYLALSSLTKYKHIVLWAVFFVMTWRQLPHRRYARFIAAIATILLGILIELEEGATGTGLCKATDLLPDAVGVLVGAFIANLWRRHGVTPSLPPASESRAS